MQIQWKCSYYVVYPAARAQSKWRVARGTGVTFRRRWGSPVDQFTINLGSHRRFNGRVPYISQNARLLAQFHPQGGVDSALDDAVQDDVCRAPRPLEASLLCDGEGRVGVRLAADIAADIAVQMQAA